MYFFLMLVFLVSTVFCNLISSSFFLVRNNWITYILTIYSQLPLTLSLTMVLKEKHKNLSTLKIDYCSYWSYNSLFTPSQLLGLTTVALGAMLYFTTGLLFEFTTASLWVISSLYIQSTVRVGYSSCRS